jgi:4'-phosphopantetheinyl transferase
VTVTGSAERRPLLRVRWRPPTGGTTADDLLADLVERHVGERLTVGRRCSRCGGGGHGQPYVEGDTVHVSLGRAPGLVVAAVSSAGPVGVDVEQAGAAGFPGFEAVAVHPDEASAEPTATWVRKEALLKATGWGLVVDPRTVLLDDAPSLVDWDERLPAPHRCRLYDLPLTDGYVGAVAVIRPAAARAG